MRPDFLFFSISTLTYSQPLQVQAPVEGCHPRGVPRSRSVEELQVRSLHLSRKYESMLTSSFLQDSQHDRLPQSLEKI